MSTVVFILVAILVQIACYEMAIGLNWWMLGRFQKYNKKDFIPFYVLFQAIRWAIRGE